MCVIKSQSSRRLHISYKQSTGSTDSESLVNKRFCDVAKGHEEGDFNIMLACQSDTKPYSTLIQNRNVAAVTHLTHIEQYENFRGLTSDCRSKHLHMPLILLNVCSLWAVKTNTASDFRGECTTPMDWCLAWIKLQAPSRQFYLSRQLGAKKLSFLNAIIETTEFQHRSCQ